VPGCGGLVGVIHLPRRWAAAAALIAVGWLVTPNSVPIYDGISAPDEPYRYVAAPKVSGAAPAATTAEVSSPVKDGTNSDGISVQTLEQGPQASVFIPPRALAAAGGPIVLTVAPKAPTTQPAGGKIDGNVYVLSLSSIAGEITTTPQAAIATLYLRSTTTVQPGPVMEYRADSRSEWKTLKTSRGGQDIYVSTFFGQGEYALAFAGAKGSSRLPVVLIGGFVVLALLVLLVVVIRVRAGRASTG
jgi:hypothetical protein